jgi:peptidoglycan hydrolase CwlO-like protein
MATSPENALTPAPRSDARGQTPLWVWLLVLVLAALAIYGGYTAASNYQRYYDTETAREALARDKDRLEANLSDLKRQTDAANKARSDAETALKQSRADTQTASEQIGDLRGQLAKAQDTIKSQEDSIAAAEAKAKKAADAKAALEKEVEALKSKLNEIQTKLDQTVSDLTKAQQQSTSQPAEPPAQP